MCNIFYVDGEPILAFHGSVRKGRLVKVKLRFEALHSTLEEDHEALVNSSAVRYSSKGGATLFTILSAKWIFENVVKLS